jgi:hypothetical protein
VRGIAPPGKNAFALSRNDAAEELNFDRIYRIYRTEKRTWHQN